MMFGLVAHYRRLLKIPVKVLSASDFRDLR
jgi:hypothetical protein